MKRILRSRRGAAIESALFFMLVVFALSMLLIASVSTMGYRNRADDRALKTRLEIEQIGYYFVTDHASFRDYTEDCGYTAAKSDDGNTLTVKSKTGKTVLYIEKTDENTILCWRYNAPAAE